jgi:hypothetical protein
MIEMEGKLGYLNKENVFSEVLFSIDTITVQLVYLAWDDSINTHPLAVLHSPQDDDWGDEWPVLFKSISV